MQKIALARGIESPTVQTVIDATLNATTLNLDLALQEITRASVTFTVIGSLYITNSLEGEAGMQGHVHATCATLGYTCSIQAISTVLERRLDEADDTQSTVSVEEEESGNTPTVEESASATVQALASGALLNVTVQVEDVNGTQPMDELATSTMEALAEASARGEEAVAADWFAIVADAQIDVAGATAPVPAQPSQIADYVAGQLGVDADAVSSQQAVFLPPSPPPKPPSPPPPSPLPSSPPPSPPPPSSPSPSSPPKKEYYGDSSITLHDLYYWVSQAYQGGWSKRNTGVTPRQRVDDIAERCQGRSDLTLMLESLGEGATCNPCDYQPPPAPPTPHSPSSGIGETAIARRLSQKVPTAVSARQASPPREAVLLEGRRLGVEDVEVVDSTTPSPAIMQFVVHAKYESGSWYHISLSPGEELMYASLEIQGLLMGTISSLGSSPVLHASEPPMGPSNRGRPVLQYVDGARPDGTGCFEGLGTRVGSEHFLTSTLNIYQSCHAKPETICCTTTEAYIWIPAVMRPKDDTLYIRRGSYFTTMRAERSAERSATYLAYVDIPFRHSTATPPAPPVPVPVPVPVAPAEPPAPPVPVPVPVPVAPEEPPSPPLMPSDSIGCTQNVIDFSQLVADEARRAGYIVESWGSGHVLCDGGGNCGNVGRVPSLLIANSNIEPCFPPSTPPSPTSSPPPSPTSSPSPSPDGSDDDDGDLPIWPLVVGPLPFIVLGGVFVWRCVLKAERRRKQFSGSTELLIKKKTNPAPRPRLFLPR